MIDLLQDGNVSSESIMKPLRARSIVLWLLLALLASPIQAQLRDSFETGTTRWRLWRDDCRAKIAESQISFLVPHSGRSSEAFQLTASNGSYLYMVYELQPTAIVEELVASLWVRAAPAGMRIGLRITFPRSLHPESRMPLQCILFGSSSRGSSEWSLVEIRNPLPLLAEQQRVLRSQYGGKIDLRDAFIDGVVLDAYTGPGAIHVQVDDLYLQPTIPASMIEAPRSDLASRGSEDEESRVARFTEHWNDLREGFPIWLQYQGENLAWLETLGITGVVLDRTPSETWLMEARASKLKIIAPPPAVFATGRDFRDWERVDAWLLGTAMDSTSLESARSLSQSLAALPTSLFRPTFVECLEDQYRYARVADLVSVPIPIPTTVDQSNQAIDIVGNMLNDIAGRSVGMISISTESPGAWLDQLRLASVLSGARVERDRMDALQFRLQVLRSIAKGPRGIFFRSSRPLDSGTVADTERATAIRLICAELSQITPWLQSGSIDSSLRLSPKQGVTVSSLKLSTSMLLMVYSSAELDNIVAAPPRDKLQFMLPPTQRSSTVLRLGNGRLEPVQKTTPEGNISVEVASPSFVEFLVATDDPRVIHYLQQSASINARSFVEQRLQIAESTLESAQATLVSERLPPSAPEWAQVRQAELEKRAAIYSLGRNDLSRAIDSADRASVLAQHVIRSSWTKALRDVPSPQSNPFLCSANTISLHWDFGRFGVNRNWANIPIGVDLAEMTAKASPTAWNLNKRLEAEVDSSVDFLSTIDVGTTPKIRFYAKSKSGQPIPGGYSGSSMRLRSPIVQAPVHSMIRIDGLVRVRQPQPVTQAGLLVYDDILGPAYGQLIRLSDHNGRVAEDAVPLTLYRLVPESGQFRLHFELRGEGEYILERLAIGYMLFDRSVVPLIPLEWEFAADLPDNPDSQQQNPVTFGSMLPSGADTKGIR